MSRLLRANFFHLKISKAYRACIGFMLLMGILSPLTSYFDKIKNGYGTPPDQILFYYCAYIGIVLSVFCALFIGTEYSDGTIRNKIVVGHSRLCIYLANLIVCFAGAFLLCLIYMVPALCLGISLLGSFVRLSVSTCMILIFASLVMTLTFVSLFTLTAMLCQNKAGTAVICILSAVLLLLAGIYINGRLQEPEYYTSAYLIMGVDEGESIDQVMEPNPHYLQGRKREVYEFLYDFLPGAQQVQFASLSAVHPFRLSLYSLCIVAVTTGGGIFFFRRKDIK